MAKDPTYPMYAQDFDMDTSFWTNEEIGVYIRLLNACWINNGLPTDLTKLSRICRMSLPDFKIIWEEIKGKFYDKNGKFYNKKQEEVREYRYQQKVNGSKGGRPKSKPVKNPNKTQTLTKSKPNKNLSNEIEIEIEVEKEIKTEKEKEVYKGEKIEFDKIVSIFNSVCKKLPEVQKLTDKRKSSIKSRIEEYSLQEIGTVFQNVSISPFLNGDNDRGWTADFDWIMNPNNFIKILEGKYNGKSKKQAGKSGVQYSDEFKQRLAEKMGA